MPAIATGQREKRETACEMKIRHSHDKLILWAFCIQFLLHRRFYSLWAHATITSNHFTLNFFLLFIRIDRAYHRRLSSVITLYNKQGLWKWNAITQKCKFQWKRCECSNTSNEETTLRCELCQNWPSFCGRRCRCRLSIVFNLNAE